jgi:cation:H+ antiporter
MFEFLRPETVAGNIALGGVALVLLVLAADLAVTKLVDLAEYLRLSTTFMGMTVVSLATSIPEITAHVTAAVGILRGTLDYEIGSSIVLGANIGSDVVQQTLIMGVVVLLAGRLYFRRYFLWKSMVPMIGTTVLCIVLGWDRVLSRVDGAILFGSFLAYTYYLYRDERKHYRPVAGEGLPEPKGESTIQNARQAWLAALVTLGSMAVTVLSAQAVLQSTEFVVRATGVGGSLIGVVTLGTASALPELITALSGVRKCAHGICLGTLVGSNITNPLVAFGLGALISTFWVPRPVLVWDLPWETATGAILWAILWFTKGRLGRVGGVYLIALYAFYMVTRAVFFAVD